jgi:hypothetical protein
MCYLIIIKSISYGEEFKLQWWWNDTSINCHVSIFNLDFLCMLRPRLSSNKRLLVFVTDDSRFGEKSKQLFASSCDQSQSGNKTKKGNKTHEEVWLAIKADCAKIAV